MIMMAMTTKKKISDGGGDHNSINIQNDDVSMDCENGDGDGDGDDDNYNDSSGDGQGEESTGSQNEAWYTVSFLSWLLVW